MFSTNLSQDAYSITENAFKLGEVVKMTMEPEDIAISRSTKVSLSMLHFVATK